MKKQVGKDNISDVFLITKKFHSIDEFSLHIETQTRRQDCRYMETLLECCDDLGIDEEVIPVLINESLRERIRAEAESLNLLTRSAGKLPIG